MKLCSSNALAKIASVVLGLSLIGRVMPNPFFLYMDNVNHKCNSYGTSWDIDGSNLQFPKHVIGGLTHSKSMVYGFNMDECFEDPIPFIAFLKFDTAKWRQISTDIMFLNHKIQMTPGDETSNEQISEITHVAFKDELQTGLIKNTDIINALAKCSTSVIVLVLKTTTKMGIFRAHVLKEYEPLMQPGLGLIKISDNGFVMAGKLLGENQFKLLTIKLDEEKFDVTKLSDGNIGISALGISGDVQYIGGDVLENQIRYPALFVIKPTSADGDQSVGYKIDTPPTDATIGIINTNQYQPKMAALIMQRSGTEVKYDSDTYHLLYENEDCKPEPFVIIAIKQPIIDATYRIPMLIAWNINKIRIISTVTDDLESKNKIATTTNYIYVSEMTNPLNTINGLQCKLDSQLLQYRQGGADLVLEQPSQENTLHEEGYYKMGQIAFRSNENNEMNATVVAIKQTSLHSIDFIYMMNTNHIRKIDPNNNDTLNNQTTQDLTEMNLSFILIQNSKNIKKYLPTDLGWKHWQEHKNVAMFTNILAIPPETNPIFDLYDCTNMQFESVEPLLTKHNYYYSGQPGYVNNEIIFDMGQRFSTKCDTATSPSCGQCPLIITYRSYNFDVKQFEQNRIDFKRNYIYKKAENKFYFQLKKENQWKEQAVNVMQFLSFRESFHQEKVSNDSYSSLASQKSEQIDYVATLPYFNGDQTYDLNSVVYVTDSATWNQLYPNILYSNGPSQYLSIFEGQLKMNSIGKPFFQMLEQPENCNGNEEVEQLPKEPILIQDELGSFNLEYMVNVLEKITSNFEIKGFQLYQLNPSTNEKEPINASVKEIYMLENNQIKLKIKNLTTEVDQMIHLMLISCLDFPMGQFQQVGFKVKTFEFENAIRMKVKKCTPNPFEEIQKFEFDRDTGTHGLFSQTILEYKFRIKYSNCFPHKFHVKDHKGNDIGGQNILYKRLDLVHYDKIKDGSISFDTSKSSQSKNITNIFNIRLQTRSRDYGDMLVKVKVKCLRIKSFELQFHEKRLPDNVEAVKSGKDVVGYQFILAYDHLNVNEPLQNLTFSTEDLVEPIQEKGFCDSFSAGVFADPSGSKILPDQAIVLWNKTQNEVTKKFKPSLVIQLNQNLERTVYLKFSTTMVQKSVPLNIKVCGWEVVTRLSPEVIELGFENSTEFTESVFTYLKLEDTICPEVSYMLAMDRWGSLNLGQNLLEIASLKDNQVKITLDLSNQFFNGQDFFLVAIPKYGVRNYVKFTSVWSVNGPSFSYDTDPSPPPPPMQVVPEVIKPPQNDTKPVEEIQEPEEEELSAEEKLARAKAEEEKRKAEEKAKRMADSGFDKIEGVGFVFPGVDVDAIDALLKKKQKQEEDEEEEYVEPPPPVMRVSRVSEIGDLSFKFDQDTYAPSQDLDSSFYQSVFNISLWIEEQQDFVVGKFIKKELNQTNSTMKKETSDRNLQQEDLGQMFNITVWKHNSKEILMNLQFDKPKNVSSEQQDMLQIDILDMSVFKSSETLKEAVIISEYDNQLVVPVPKQLAPEVAVAIETSTQSMKSIIEASSSGNFFIALLVGASMQQLWGTIRAMQMIVLSGLIRISLPGHSFLFMAGCMQFAQIDVFDGQRLYQLAFNFTETQPVNSNFLLLGINDRNYLLNTGSYYIFFFCCVLQILVRITINSLAKQSWKKKRCRNCGIKVYSKNFWKDLKYQQIKLFIESYFDLSFCCLMYTSVLIESIQEGHWTKFFTYQDDIFNSLLGMIYFWLVIPFPFVVTFILSQKYNKLKTNKVRYVYSIFYEDNRVNTRFQAYYLAIFLTRRLASATILVFVNSIPVLQCLLLTYFSMANLCYLTSQKPLIQSEENKVEIINEYFILGSLYMMIQFLVMSHDKDFIDTLGWVFIGFVCLNVFYNLSLLTYKSFLQWRVNRTEEKKRKKGRRLFGEYMKVRQDLLKQKPEMFEEFKFAGERLNAIEQCREWYPHREWLLANGISVKNLPEENTFQTNMETYKFLYEAKFQRIRTGLKVLAVDRADHLIKMRIIKEIQRQQEAKLEQIQEKFWTNDKNLVEQDGLEGIHPKIKLSSDQTLQNHKSRNLHKYKITTIKEEENDENSDEEDNLVSGSNQASFRNLVQLKANQQKPIVFHKVINGLQRNMVFKEYHNHESLHVTQEREHQAFQNKLKEMKSGESKLQRKSTIIRRDDFNNQAELKKNEAELLIQAREQAYDIQFLNFQEGDDHYINDLKALLYKKPQERLEEMSKSAGITQMENAGRNYYIGAVLQVFMSIDPLAKFIVGEEFLKYGSGNLFEDHPVCESLRNVYIDNFQERPEEIQSKKEVIDIYQLMEYMEPEDTEVSGDPSILMQEIFDAIINETKNFTGKERSPFDLQQIFGSKKNCFHKCYLCKTVFKKETTEQMIINLPQNGSVKVRLERLVEPNYFDHLYCEKCEKNTSFHQYFTFQDLSEYLVFSQKMFEDGLRTGTVMAYFKDLDMKPFLDASDPNSCKNSYKYDLFGLIMCKKSCQNLESSEYTAFINRKEPLTHKDRWLRCNDQKVKEITFYDAFPDKLVPHIIIFKRHSEHNVRFLKRML